MVGREIRILTGLAWPVVAAQVGSMMLGIVDAWMVGRLGSTELGAVALADTCLFGSLILGLGLVMGIDPLVTQAHGAGEGDRVARALQRGIVLALLVTLPLTVIWLSTGWILGLFRQGAEHVAMAQTYASVQVFSIAPMLVFHALRQYLQGRGHMRAPLWIVLAANLLNVLFNWVLIFGNLGFPALGFRGAGIATGLTRVFMCVGLVAIILMQGLHRGAWVPWSRTVFRLRGLHDPLRDALRAPAIRAGADLH